MGLLVQVIGLEELMSAVNTFGQIYTAAASEAARREAAYDLELTKPQVPIETGSLLSTGRVETDTQEGSAFVMSAIAYGGPLGTGPGQTRDVDYAVIVHEDLEAYHPHGKAKFVEDPVRGEFSSGRAASRMAATILELVPNPFVSSRMGRYKGRSTLFWTRGEGGRFTGSVGY